MVTLVMLYTPSSSTRHQATSAIENSSPAIEHVLISPSTAKFDQLLEIVPLWNVVTMEEGKTGKSKHLQQ